MMAKIMPKKLIPCVVFRYLRASKGQKQLKFNDYGRRKERLGREIQQG